MPSLPPRDSIYRGGSFWASALLVVVGLVLVVTLALMGVAKSGALVPAIFYGALLAIPLILFGWWGMISAQTTRYEVDAEGIVAYDWQNRRTGSVAWSDVISFGLNTPPLCSNPAWLLLKTRNAEVKIPINMSNGPLLSIAIFSHLPAGVEPEHAKKVSELSRRSVS